MTAEEQRLERKSRMLLDHLSRTEQRANELKMETERLRRIKDEAKAMVMRKHPNLFQPTASDEELDLSSLSEGNNGRFFHDSRLSKDLLEIKNMLEKRSGDSSMEQKFDTHMRNIRREAGVGSSRQSERSGFAGNSTNSYAWPKDCVPVPMETLKRLLEESSLNVQSSLELPEREQDEDLFDHNLNAFIQNQPGNLSDHDRPETGKSNDDTSNDAAELSQENDIKPKLVKRNISTGAVPKQKSPVPKPEPARRGSSNKSAGKNAIPCEPVENSNARLANNRVSSESSREADENFVLSSADDEKLYSSASDSNQIIDEREEDSHNSKKSSSSSSKMVNKKYKPPPIVQRTASKLSTSSEEVQLPQQKKIEPKNNPLSKYLSSNVVKVASDSDSNAAAVKQKDGNVELYSGPEDEAMDEDDFWN